MKIPFKTKLAYWWWRKLNYKKPANLIQKISNSSNGLNSILFILPKGRTRFPVAVHFLKTIFDKGHSGVINKIISYEDNIGTINGSFADHLLLIKNDDLSKFGLIKNAVINDLKKISVKCLVNLDPDQFPATLQIVNTINAEIRIGFGSTESTDFYNISIENDGSKNYIEKSYKYFLEVLGL